MSWYHGREDIWAHRGRAFLWAELRRRSPVWSVSVFSALGEVAPGTIFPRACGEELQNKSPTASLGEPQHPPPAAPQGVKAVPLHPGKPQGARGSSNCCSRTGRGIGRCGDLIVFFHSYCSGHRELLVVLIRVSQTLTLAKI